MGRFASAAILILLLSAPQGSWAEVRKVMLSTVHPTQAAAGIALVIQMANNQFEKYHGDPGESLRHFVDKPMPAITAPDGQVWITDRHHGALLFYELLKRAGEKDGAVEIDEKASFEGKPWESFHRYLKENGFVYFTPEVRRMEKPFSEKLKFLPASIAELYKNDEPLRTFVANAFYFYGIDSELFKPYIEFYVVEALKKEGFHLPRGGEMNPDFIRDHAYWIAKKEPMRVLENATKDEKSAKILKPLFEQIRKSCFVKTVQLNAQ